MPKLSKKEFYEKYYPAVVKATKGTGLHPEAVIAQMAIETGWGGSGLSSKHNNFFGIKSHGKEGGVTMTTEEERDGKRGKEQASFRTYESPEDGIKGFVDFLQNNPRYEKAGVFSAETPDEQAEAMQKAGYATSSRYANDIKRTMSANNSILDTIPEHSEYIDSRGKAKKKSGLAVVTKDGKDIIVSPDGKAYEVKGEGGITDSDMKWIESQMDSAAISENDRYQKAEGVDGATLMAELKDDKSGTVPNSRWMEGAVKKEGQNVPQWMKDSYDKIKGAYDKGADVEVGDSRSDFIKKPAPKLGGEDGVADTESVEDFKVKIDDLDATDPLGDPKNVNAVDDIDAIRQRIAENENLLGSLERRPAFDDSYAPDAQGRDIGGYITDAARGIMGVAGATKPLPVYERGEMFQTSMDELTDRRNMGLTADEIGFAKQMAERGYGYDVKNIRRMAGGSAGVALGNLGRATGQLYDEYGKLAVRDEGVRRQNRADFNRGALSDEQVNRQIFEDKYNEDWTSKMAASGLVQDSIKNIKERNQFEKAYGKGSQMYEYEKELTLDRRHARENLDWANKQADEKATSELKSGLFNDRKRLVELENKNSGEAFVNGNSGFIPQNNKSGIVDSVSSGGMTREDGLRKLGLNESMLENLDAAGVKQVSDKLLEMGVSF